MIHRSNKYRANAKERLTSEEGLYHRSRRPVEPEAVFSDIKYDHGFKRFRLMGNAKVNVEFSLVALAHHLCKYDRVLPLRRSINAEATAVQNEKTSKIKAT